MCVSLVVASSDCTVGISTDGGVQDVQHCEAHQRIAAAWPHRTPVGVAAAACHPVCGDCCRHLQREPAVRKSFRF